MNDIISYPSDKERFNPSLPFCRHQVARAVLTTALPLPACLLVGAEKALQHGQRRVAASRSGLLAVEHGDKS
jgi:hypothetical protein